MKARLYHWPIVAIFLLAGCLPSLNPVYTERDVVFDPAVVGVWKQPNVSATWNFAKRDETSYQVVYTDENGHAGHFVGHLARVDGKLFLDLFPAEVANSENDFYRAHQVPLHSIYMVRRTTPHVVMAAIDYGWLDKFLIDNPDALPHTRFNGNRLITASTEELQAFLKHHPEVFKGDVILERK